MFGLDAGSDAARSRSLRAAAERYADRPAYVEGRRTLSYAEPARPGRATVARGYVALGLEPGESGRGLGPEQHRVGVAALAVTYAGGTLVPVNSRYTGHEVADIVDRTGAVIAVVADGFLGRTQIADLRAASDLPSVREVVDLADLASLVRRGRDTARRRSRPAPTPSPPTTWPTSCSPPAPPADPRAR